jgi:hypothetical protein
MTSDQGYTIRFDHGIADIDFHLPAARADLQRVLESVAAHAGSPLRGLLLKSSVPGWNPSTASIEQVADMLGEYGRLFSRRVAIVVPEPLQYGLGRMMEVFAERHGIACQTFWGADEALAWLGVASREERRV